ncbi:MAG: MarR family transcriptional regulator [Candidatus Caldatribacteriota bacterium]|nr:MarR family transcriptional regulator [Candidatus Caldatribacteriota bacterium]
MLITERYEDQIHGTISCFDRIIIQGVIPGWCYAQGMTSYLYANDIRIFDYPKFAEPLNKRIRENAERVAKENEIEIEFIRKIRAFRKDDRIKEIIKKRGSHSGLVHIFSAMETCNTYKPWHNKQTGKTYLKFAQSKCLHYYFYFIDKELGLCYLRVPTWCPFRLQFYMNGHNWLAAKLTKNNIDYVMRENAFLEISDFNKAQKISDKIRVENLHQALDIFVTRYCPVINDYNLKYAWSLMQVEYATDIVFKQQADLNLIYDNIIRTAIHSVKPDNIASFLGKKLTLRYEGEIGNNFNTRILGTRIKHHMGEVSIKMYDKFGIVLRIESTCNDISKFSHMRDVRHKDGTTTKRKAPMRKYIYSLFPLGKILKDANNRYLEFVSTFDDPSDGLKSLKQISETVEDSKRTYKGFNFYNKEDQKLFEVLVRGEFNIKGFQNKTIRKFMPQKSSASISRIIKRLYTHGLIEKINGTYKYYLSELGKAVITTGLRVKNLFVIPELSGIRVVSC